MFGVISGTNIPVKQWNKDELQVFQTVKICFEEIQQAQKQMIEETKNNNKKLETLLAEIKLGNGTGSG